MTIRTIRFNAVLTNFVRVTAFKTSSCIRILKLKLENSQKIRKSIELDHHFLVSETPKTYMHIES